LRGLQKQLKQQQRHQHFQCSSTGMSQSSCCHIVLTVQTNHSVTDSWTSNSNCRHRWITTSPFEIVQNCCLSTGMHNLRSSCR
jgi:hypothetical protein